MNKHLPSVGIGSLEPLVARPCCRLAEYWEEIRGGELIPGRDDVDPGALVELLPEIFLLESCEPGHIVMRLSGTEHRFRLGREVTGMNIRTLVAPDQIAERVGRLSAAISWPCGIATIGAMLSANGMEIPFCSLSLPLRPRKAGGGAMLIGLLTSMDGRRWSSFNGMVLTERLDATRFVDIGAGTPDQGEWPQAAPADWPTANA